MSTRVWTTSDGWQVRTGWDHLGHYFLTIGRPCQGCDGGLGLAIGDSLSCKTCHGSGTEYLFNNLDARPGPYGAMRDLDDVLNTLLAFGIPMPESLDAVLIVDQLDGSQGNNEVVEYGELARR